MKRQQYLDKHIYEIYQGSDGFWRTYLPPEDPDKKRKLLKRKSRKDLEDIVIRFWKDQTEDPSFEDVFHESNRLRRDNGAIASSTYDQNNRIYNRFCKDFGKLKIRQIREMDVLDFLEAQPALCQQREGKPLTSKAFSNLKGIIKETFKRARRCGHTSLRIEQILDDLDVNQKKLKKPGREEKDDVFTEEELPVFITYLKENLDIQNAGLLLMLVTGLRVGELATLKHTDIEQTDGIYLIHVKRTETKYRDTSGKNVYDVKESPKTTAGIRTVVIPPEYEWLMKKLRAFNPFSEFIFTNARGERMTTNCFRMRQNRVCDKLGFKHKSPHKSRKTYGTLLLDNSCDMNFITNQMGHTNIATTESYYHKDMKSAKAKAEMLGNIRAFSAV